MIEHQRHSSGLPFSKTAVMIFLCLLNTEKLNVESIDAYTSDDDFIGISSHPGKLGFFSFILFSYKSRNLGSSLSRSQSPKRLPESTIRVMTTPGIKETHQAETRIPLPSAHIEPHEGIGGGMPAPKKLRVASRVITVPTLKVAKTIKLFSTLGKM